MKRAASLMAAWVMVSALVLAQQQDPKKFKDFRLENIQIVMELQNIQLSFLVRDQEGTFIRNLSADDFVLFENGGERKILSLEQHEVPISAVIAVDTSWSISPYLGNAVQLAGEFFSALEREKAAFMFFSEQPRMVIDFDQGSRDLTAPLAEVRPDGKTALYDSLIWAAENLFKGRSGKKLIILLSDGIDTASEKSFPEMIQTLRSAGITFYPIIYTNDIISKLRRRVHATGSRGYYNHISTTFLNFLVLQNHFLDESLRYGGRAIFSNAFGDLGKIYRDIVQEMKSQYVMFYASDAEEPEDGRQVKVQTRKVPGKIFISIGS